MSLILSIETSTGVCSVALHDDATLVATAELHREQSHAAKLAVFINQVLDMADVRMADIQAVAVSAGPGSYTGLRIGTSTAKGICYAAGIPLVAPGTLEIMAAEISGANAGAASLCPMLDARRMEVYCQVFNAAGESVMPPQAKIIDENSFEELLNAGPVLFFGNGAEKCREVIRHVNARFIEGVYPKASVLGRVAFSRLKKGEIEDLARFEPFYLKDFIAKKAQPVLDR